MLKQTPQFMQHCEKFLEEMSDSVKNILGPLNPSQVLAITPNEEEEENNIPGI